MILALLSPCLYRLLPYLIASSWIVLPCCDRCPIVCPVRTCIHESIFTLRDCSNCSGLFGTLMYLVRALVRTEVPLDMLSGTRNVCITSRCRRSRRVSRERLTLLCCVACHTSFARDCVTLVLVCCAVHLTRYGVSLHAPILVYLSLAVSDSHNATSVEAFLSRPTSQRLYRRSVCCVGLCSTHSYSASRQDRESLSFRGALYSVTSYVLSATA